MSLTIKDIISDVTLIEEDDIVHAKKFDGKFLEESEVVLLKLTEKENNISPQLIAQLKCPGFDYFLEGFLIQEIVMSLNDSDLSLKQKIDSVIQYVEFDS